MPRYFFDMHDGAEIRDAIGREIDHPRLVRREALCVATALAAEEGEDGSACSLVLTVRDEEGGDVLSVRLVCQIREAGASVPRRRAG